MQTIRSFFFVVQMYIAMPIIGLLYLPWTIVSPKGAHAGCHAYSRWVIWTLDWMCNLKVEVRGTPPDFECMVAAKHQSFLDILTIYYYMPRGKFIMKAILRFAPVIGQYGLRIGCVPVDRGKRGAAIKKMLEDVQTGKQQGGQLIIYPQGTRVAPGEDRPYKIGTGILYEQLGQPVVPVATNVGVFWPKRGITRHPGTAVIHYLPRIEPGLPKEEFMERLEADIEGVSNQLLDEAGFERRVSHANN